jgi:hypothetical protein
LVQSLVPLSVQSLMLLLVQGMVLLLPLCTLLLLNLRRTDFGRHLVPLLYDRLVSLLLLLSL